MMESDQNNRDEDDMSSIWLPRQVQNRTNWLYRMDALRPHDINEMNILWELVCVFKDYAIQYLIWAHILVRKIKESRSGSIRIKTRKVLKLVRSMVQLLWAESYCYFLDFLEISYYPISNRFSSRGMNGPRFPPCKNNCISQLGTNEAKEMTGFSKHQLEIL